MRREASTGAAHQPDIGYRCPLALHARDTCSTPFDYASHACNTPLFAFPLFLSFFSLFLHSSLGIWKFLASEIGKFRNSKFENFHLLFYWNLKILLCILFPEIWKFLWSFSSSLFSEIFKISILFLYSLKFKNSFSVFYSLKFGNFFETFFLLFFCSGNFFVFSILSKI